MVRCGSSKNGHPKSMSKRDWTMSSKSANHFRLNSQRNWANLYDDLIRKRVNKILI